MKLFVAAALLLGYSSCKSFKDLSKQKDGDDVYFSMKDAKKERAAEKKRKEEEDKKAAEEAKQKQIQDNNAKAMATSPGTDYYSQPFDYDDYYDYEYAARLRRFDHPCGGGYYDNYYTNAYFYNGDPYYYGTSVYNSYNFWGPSSYAYYNCPSAYYYYNSGWGWGTGMYYGSPYGYYDPWANSGWGYYPYYSYYPGWNSGYYPYGYGNGYNGWGGGCGNNGYAGNNYYFNSYDENSYYYGPRHSPSSSDGRPVGSGGPAFGERFANAVAAENNIQNADVHDVNRVTASAPKSGTASQSSAGRDDVNSTNTGRAVDNSSSATDGSNSQSLQRNETSTPPAPVYTQPEYSNSNSGSNSNTNSNSGSTSTPAQPDYSRPTNNNTYQQPSNNESRNDNSGSSGSNNSGGSNSNSNSRPSGNSGTSSGTRPR